MFALPNNKVMTAALTRSYEKDSTVLSRSQNCCSVNEADFSTDDSPVRRKRWIPRSGCITIAYKSRYSSDE